MTPELAHIIDRFIIHFFAAASVYLCVHFAVRYAARKWVHWQLALPALLALGFAGWREAYDVYMGQTFTKAVTDWISWGAGLGVAAWALYRYRKEHW